jgi:hypothetical protein
MTSGGTDLLAVLTVHKMKLKSGDTYRNGSKLSAYLDIKGNEVC